MKKSSARIKVYGVNISKLYKLLKKNSIDMMDICRENYKTIYFTVVSSNIKKLFALLDKSCYTITVVEYYGAKKYLEFFKLRFGYIIGLAVFIVLIALSNMFVSDIKVYGENKVSSKEIYACLSQNGIKKGSLMTKCSNEQISSILTDNFDDISLVSVLKKGTNIVINIKEKQSVSQDDNTNPNDIVAQFDGTVLEISMMQGTALVRQGDTFKKGDVLVKGSFKDIDGVEISCKAQATIKAKVMLTSEIDFKTEAEVYVRTGRVIKNSYMSIFGLEILKKSAENTFMNFEVENSDEYLFNNNLLPIKLVSEKYFETEKQLVHQNFDDFKQKLERETKKNAKKLLENSDEIVNEFGEIIELDDGYKVRYTCEVIKEF